MSGDAVVAGAETRLLVSVRDTGEPLAVASAGADFRLGGIPLPGAPGSSKE